jgi:uncharacterized CHY-type Zn-finger protein
MSSVVSAFIIQPALRQVRRFSRSTIANNGDLSQFKTTRVPTSQSSTSDDAISAIAGDSTVREEEYASLLAAPSSWSSMIANSCRKAAQLHVHTPSHDDTVLRDAGSVSDREVGLGDTMEQASVTSLDPLPDSDLEMRDEAANPDGDAAIEAPSMSANTIVTPQAAVVTDKREQLPEDDGMGPLRRRILDIQAMNLPAADQACLMHKLLMEGYTKSQIVVQSKRPVSPSAMITWEQTEAHKPLDSFKFWQGVLGEASIADKFVLTEDDIRPTFAPLKEGEETNEFRPLGCEHYRRNVKLQCSTCARWYTCRFCHDNVEDHALIRKDTKNMLCMFCGIAQKAGEACVNCGETAAVYYCSICKLWNNDPDKSIYHCNDCGICRIGRGLGKDFFHCKVRLRPFGPPCVFTNPYPTEMLRVPRNKY